MDRRRIAIIVSPWYPVPPNGYGGIELMAYHLARELQRRGHEVSVIGQQGSKGEFETIAIAPESWSGQLGTRDQVPRESLFLYRAYELIRKRAFDVVHDHSGLTGILMAASTRLQTPVVATLHGDGPSKSRTTATGFESHLPACRGGRRCPKGTAGWGDSRC